MNVLDQSLSFNTDIDINLDTINNILNTSKQSYASTHEETNLKEGRSRQIKIMKESLEKHDLARQQDELKRIQLLPSKQQIATEFFSLFKNRDIYLQ